MGEPEGGGALEGRMWRVSVCLREHRCRYLISKQAKKKKGKKPSLDLAPGIIAPPVQDRNPDPVDGHGQRQIIESDLEANRAPMFAQAGNERQRWKPGHVNPSRACDWRGVRLHLL